VLAEREALGVRSTMKQVMPSCLRPGRSWPKTRNTLAPAVGDEPLGPVQDVLVAFEHGRAFHRRRSEPALGSVRPNAPSSSPVAIRGRYFSFCASVPQLTMGQQASELWTAVMTPVERRHGIFPRWRWPAR